MGTFFLTFRVVPTTDNEHYYLVKGALANCWVLEDSPENAFSKAFFYVSKGDWEVEEIENFPVETTENHFIGKDIGLQNYEKAQEDGSARGCRMDFAFFWNQ